MDASCRNTPDWGTTTITKCPASETAELGLVTQSRYDLPRGRNCRLFEPFVKQFETIKL
jgi:hypothetical protein